MTKVIPCIIFILLFFWVCPVFAKSDILGRVEISFDYNRAERDYANNQFAVWIEDQDGNLIETLFVTKFTATKGWRIREETLPTWKNKANLADLKKDEVDGITGATPLAQQLVYTWVVKAGEHQALQHGYKYFVECNYYWKDTVLYSGKIQVGNNENTSEAFAHFSTESAKDYNIIENVTAKFVPLR